MNWAAGVACLAILARLEGMAYKLSGRSKNKRNWTPYFFSFSSSEKLRFSVSNLQRNAPSKASRIACSIYRLIGGLVGRTASSSVQGSVGRSVCLPAHLSAGWPAGRSLSYQSAGRPPSRGVIDWPVGCLSRCQSAKRADARPSSPSVGRSVDQRSAVVWSASRLPGRSARGRCPFTIQANQSPLLLSLLPIFCRFLRRRPSNGILRMANYRRFLLLVCNRMRYLTC